jgi:hypothetical protein
MYYYLVGDGGRFGRTCQQQKSQVIALFHKDPILLNALLACSFTSTESSFKSWQSFSGQE